MLAAGHDGATCPQCAEEFETFYDSEKEEWRLRDALFDEELSKLFHPLCHQVWTQIVKISYLCKIKPKAERIELMKY